MMLAMDIFGNELRGAELLPRRW